MLGLWVLLVSVFLVQPVAGVASDWWGNVTIINSSGTVNTSTDGAVIVALVNNASQTHDIVGTPDTTYYLIHVDGSAGDLIMFQVYGVNASPTNLTQESWIEGSQPQLDLIAHLIASGSTCPASYATQPPTGNIHNGCSEGFCVHDTCRAAATHCGDGFCDSGESCSSDDSACASGQACTNGCVATASGGGGSGGGGGGGAAPPAEDDDEPEEEPTSDDPEETQTTPSIEPGATGVVIYSTNILINSLAITAQNALESSEITIVKSTTPPSGVPTPPDILLNYLTVTTDLSDDDIDSVLISFDVPKTWIIPNNIDPSSVVLRRFTGSWDTLPTTQTGEDGTSIFYDAVSPGLSTFVITGTPLPGQICTPGNAMCDGDAVIQCTSDGTAWITVEQCPDGCVDSQCIQPSSPAGQFFTLGAGSLTIALVVVLIILLTVFVLMRRRH